MLFRSHDKVRNNYDELRVAWRPQKINVQLGCSSTMSQSQTIFIKNQNKKEFIPSTSQGSRESLFEKIQRILQQESFRNKALKKIHSRCNNLMNQQIMSVSHADVFRNRGCIFALVHLPSNSIYVVMTKKRIDHAVKQHWYRADCFSSKFHRHLLTSHLHDLFVWPLEYLDSSSAEASSRKNSG